MKLEDFGMKKTIIKEKKYYLVYARKSSETEDRQAQSIPDQLKALNELAKSKNLNILKTFSESKSAKAPGRPEFNAMISLINERQDIKGIIAWKLNRLSRNPVDSGSLQWLLQAQAIDEIVTINKTYIEEDSDYIMSVEGAGANRFIRDLRSDTWRGINTKLEKGQFPGMAPIGYQNNPGKKQGDRNIDTHPIEFPLLRKIFDLALTGVFTVEYLRQEAKRLGLRTKIGNIISVSTTNYILRNPFYTGKFFYNGKIYQGTHTAMISEAEYDILQDILSGRDRRNVITNDFPFKNVLECGNCDSHKMIVGMTHNKTYANGTTQKFVNYTCSQVTNKNKGGPTCNQSYVKESKIKEQILTNILDKFFIPQEFVDWALKWIWKENQEQNRIKQANFKALEAIQTDIRAKITNLTDLMISPLNKDRSIMSDEDFATKKSELTRELEKVTNQNAGSNRQMIKWMDVCVKAFNYCASAKDKFENGSPAKKRSILRNLDLNLRLKDGKVEFMLENPFEPIMRVFEGMKQTMLLEPNQNIAVAARLSSLDPSKTVWGERWDLNPQPPASQASALTN